MAALVANDTTSHESGKHRVYEGRVYLSVDAPGVREGDFIREGILLIVVHFFLNFCKEASKKLLAVVLLVRFQEGMADFI